MFKVNKNINNNKNQANASISISCLRASFLSILVDCHWLNQTMVHHNHGYHRDKLSIHNYGYHGASL